MDALKKEVNDDDAIEELAAIPFGVWMYSEVAPNDFLPELQNCFSKKELGILRKTNAVLFLFPVIDDKGEIREVKSIKITGDDRSVRNVSGRSIARLDRRFKEFFRFEDYGKMKRYSCEYQCVLGVSFSFSNKTISIGFPFPILSKE